MIKILFEWRVDVLLALACITCFFALCEAETTGLFLISKAIAIATGTATYLLARYWDARGKLESLAELVKEED